VDKDSSSQHDRIAEVAGLDLGLTHWDKSNIAVQYLLRHQLQESVTR
jgi:hypothetical protein